MEMKIIALVAIFSLIGCVESKVNSCGPGTFKIPERISPFHYDLTIELDSDIMSTKGSVDIRLIVTNKQPSCWNYFLGIVKEFEGKNQIVLNADPDFILINDETISYTTSKGKKIEVKGLCYDYEFRNIVVSLAEDLSLYEIGTLHMDFWGKINNKTGGLFRDDSYRADGKTSRQILTQFEAADARKVFPCFDEPNFKATFKLTIIHPAHETVLSNTEVVSSIKHAYRDDKKVTKFAETPKMSTYLLAFAIGQFDYVERITDDGKITIRVYTPPGRSKEGRMAADIAQKAMGATLQYFGDEFPLKKVDFVSSPNFDFGAMENFGLIVCADLHLLMDENSSLARQRQSKQTIAHELTHNWLGNMVTLNWWNDAWLNEGFTDYFGMEFADQIFQDDGIEVSRRVGDLMQIRDEDLHYKVRPEGVKYEREIEGVFSLENYGKGASIVRMLRDYVGPEEFQKAMREYISTYKYKNVQYKDFIPFMEKYGQRPVKKFIKSWLNYEGHPMFSVSWSKNSTGSVLNIKQTAYPDIKRSKHLWFTPINVLLESSSRKEEVEFTIDRRNTFIRLPKWFDPSLPGSFVKFDPEAIGFYHVLYTKPMFDSLLLAIKEKRLSAVDRIDLIKTTGKMVQHQKQPLDYLEQLFESLEGEQNPVVLCAMLEVTKEPNLVRVALNLAQDLFLRHKFTEPIEFNKCQLHYYIKMLSILHLHRWPVITEAREVFDKDRSGIPVTMRDLIYTIIVGYGTTEQLERLIGWAKSTESFAERARAYEALSDASESKKIMTVIEALRNDPKPFVQKKDLLDKLARKLEKLNMVNFLDYKKGIV